MFLKISNVLFIFTVIVVLGIAGCDVASLDPKTAVRDTALAGQKVLFLDINSLETAEQYDKVIDYWQSISTRNCPQDFRDKFDKWRSIEIERLQKYKAGDNNAGNDMVKEKLDSGKEALDLAEQKYGYKRRIGFKLYPYNDWIKLELR
jgi:hypothetical protein